MVEWLRASQASGIVMHSYGMLKCDGCLTTTWYTLSLNKMIDIVNVPKEINFFLLSVRNCFPFLSIFKNDQPPCYRCYCKLSSMSCGGCLIFPQKVKFQVSLRVKFQLRFLWKHSLRVQYIVCLVQAIKVTSLAYLLSLRTGTAVCLNINISLDIAFSCRYPILKSQKWLNRDTEITWNVEHLQINGE